MAGRPVDPAIREKRKREVDAAISLLASLGKPATRKNIANEMGLSVQNLYGPGYLSVYIQELETSGVVRSEQDLHPQLSSSEVKVLQKENKHLKTENARLQKQYNKACESMAQQAQEIESLSQDLLRVKGDLFKLRQQAFARSRI